MAYNTRIDTGSRPSQDGNNYRIYVESQDTGSTTTVDPGYPAFNISRGEQSGRLFDALRQRKAEVVLKTDNATALSYLRGIQGDGPRDHQVRIVRNGNTTIFTGHVLTEHLTNRYVEDTQEITLQASGRLGSLDNVDFTDASDNKFEGNEQLIKIIAFCLGEAGYDYPIKGRLNWYPHDWDSTKDPLKVLVPYDNFYEETDAGDLIADSCGEVLDQLLHKCTLDLTHHENTWYLFNPQEIEEDGTGSLVLTDYDSDGVDQGTTEDVDMVVDVSSEPWLRDSDELRGGPAYRKAEHTYTFGPGAVPDVTNPGFEKLKQDGVTPRGWSFSASVSGDNFISFNGDTHISPEQNIKEPIEGDRSVGIRGRARPSSRSFSDWEDNTIAADAQRYVSQTFGEVTTGTSGVRVSFDCIPYAESQDAKGFSNYQQTYKAWYSVKHGGKFYDAENDEWVDSEVKNPMTTGSDDRTWSARSPETHREVVDLPDAVVTGDLQLRLWETFGKYESDNVGDAVWMLYDEVALEQLADSGEPAGSTTFIAEDANVPDGKTWESEAVVGDGPFDEAAGAIFKNSTDPTSDWKVGPYSGESATGLTLGQLATREQMRSLRKGRKRLRYTLSDSPNIAPYQAIDDGDRWYFPVYHKIQHPTNFLTLEVEELRYDTSNVTTDEREVADAARRFGGDTVSVHQDLTTRLGELLGGLQLTATTSDLASDTSHTSIDVEALDDRVEDGAKLTIVNASTGTRFVVTVEGQADSGATSISIESFTPSERIVEGSHVYRGGANLNTYLQVAHRAINLYTESGEVCSLDETIDGAVRTSINVTNVWTNQPKGTHLTIVGGENTERTEIVLDEELKPGMTSVSIQEQVVTGINGDSIVFSGASLSAGLRVQPHLVDQYVQKKRDDESIAQLSSDVSGTVTSLPVKNLDQDLSDTDKIQVITRSGSVYNLKVDGSASSGDSSITIESDTVTAAEDSQVYAGWGAASSRLSVEMQSITADTNIFKERDWDGSVNDQGEITDFATTETWAMTGAGHVDFRDSSGNYYHKNADTHELASAGKTKFDLWNETLTFGDASDPTTGVGVFIGDNAGTYEIRAGDPSGEHFHWDGTNVKYTGQVLESTIIEEVTIDTGSVTWASSTGTLDSSGMRLDANSGKFSAASIDWEDGLGGSTVMSIGTEVSSNVIQRAYLTVTNPDSIDELEMDLSVLRVLGAIEPNTLDAGQFPTSDQGNGVTVFVNSNNLLEVSS